MTRNLPAPRYEMPPPRPRGLGPLALAYLILLAVLLGALAWAVAATPQATRDTATLTIPPRNITLPAPAAAPDTQTPSGDAATEPADTSDEPEEESEAVPAPGEAPGVDAAATGSVASGATDDDADRGDEEQEEAEVAAEEVPARPVTPPPVPRPDERALDDGTPAASAETPAETSSSSPPAADSPEPADEDTEAEAAGTEPDGTADASPADVGEDGTGTPEPAAAPQTALAPPIGPDEEITLATVDPALSEAGAAGPLPAVAADGRTPWQTYRRPYRAPAGRPVIAVMISGLGLSAGPTQAAIQDLPPQVSLAFMPYAENLDEWVAYARAAGHEVFVNVPMEPYNYPANDPGQQALLTDLTPEENRQNLRWTLSRFAGYVGVTNYMGSLFTTEAEAMRPVIDELNARGLMYFDSWPSRTSVVPELAGETGLPYASSVGFIDLSPSTAAIRGRLDEVEKIARETGYAAAIGLAFPLTIDVLADWSRTLDDRGFTLVPVSAMVTYER